MRLRLVKMGDDLETTSAAPPASPFELTRAQYLIGTAFQAGVAYLTYKHKHPYWAYFFGAGAAVSLIRAVGAKR